MSLPHASSSLFWPSSSSTCLQMQVREGRAGNPPSELLPVHPESRQGFSANPSHHGLCFSNLAQVFPSTRVFSWDPGSPSKPRLGLPSAAHFSPSLVPLNCFLQNPKISSLEPTTPGVRKRSLSLSPFLVSSPPHSPLFFPDTY